MTQLNFTPLSPYTFPNAPAIVTAIILLALIIIILEGIYIPDPHKWRSIWMALLIFWLFTIASATLIRPEEDGRLRLELFWTFRTAWTKRSGLHWYYILGNIALFMPLGMLLPWSCKWMNRWWRVAGAGMLLSITIELTQYIMATGLYELDDVLHNTWGTALGYQFGIILQYLQPNLFGYEKRKVLSLVYGGDFCCSYRPFFYHRDCL